MVTVAGRAVLSDDEVNSRKYPPAVAARMAVSRIRGWKPTSRARRINRRLAARSGPAAPDGGTPTITALVPASLVRFGRSARFRQAVAAIAKARDLEAGELSARLVTALATFAHTLGKDLSEADWSRILDALLLVAAHPADP